MFQDLKNIIYYPILTIFASIKDNGGFNPKPSKSRDFSVLSITEHAQIVLKLQRQFHKGKHKLNKQNFLSLLAWNMLIHIQSSIWVGVGFHGD